MFATSVRVSPCSDRCIRSSEGRRTASVPFSGTTSMSGCSSRLSWPFGPLTVTRGRSICTSTPLGTGIGAFPIRDMRRLLPDVAEDLAADVGPTGLRGGHEPPRGRNDRYAQPAEDARHVLALDVHPQ